jgi:histidinol-phosphate aminotransferase
MSVNCFTDRAHPLVSAAPTFEDPAAQAQRMGVAVRAVPVDRALRLDLAGMGAGAEGAGLVFFCNPNNPTSTVHSGRAVQDFVRRVLRSSPDTTILIDEAYHEYVEDPTYATSIPLAMENPRVIVSRTFSKIFGLAGMRIGYAIGHTSTMKRLEKERLPSSVNVLGATAALASLNDTAHIDRERALNHSVKEFTRSFFEKAGYRVVPSHTNFVMVDIRRDSKQFQDACKKRDILVGRPFPPLTTLARVSLGTMDEMRRATDVFKSVLSVA